MLRFLTPSPSHDELFACTHAATGYVRQARAHSGPPKNISSSVEVAIDRESAMRTIVPSLSECLLHRQAATGTLLAGISSIHLDNSHTGPFSLVAKHREEFGPRSVMHVPRKRTARQRVHAKAGSVERNSRKLAKAEAAPPADPAEARRTCLAPVFFDASEKTGVGVVQAFQRRSLKVRWNSCRLRVGLPPRSKAPRLIDIRERHTMPMGADPLFQCCVVELPLRFKQFVKHPVLGACRNYTVLVCENHVFETIRFLAHSVSHAEMP